MSIFNNSNDVKITWPSFKWKTGKKIRQEKVVNQDTNKDVQLEESADSNNSLVNDTNMKWACPNFKEGENELIHSDQCLECIGECKGELCIDCCTKEYEGDIDIENEDNEDNEVPIAEEKSTKTKKKKSKKDTEYIEVDEILNIRSGSILRIDGVEYQIHISISENQEVTTDYIHKKVINPNGLINKWEYKNAALKYDEDDNIFYYILESPKKG